MAHQGSYHLQGQSGSNQDYRRDPDNQKRRYNDKDGGNYRPPSGGYPNRPRSGRGGHKGRPTNRGGEEHDREPSPDRTGYDDYSDTHGYNPDSRQYGDRQKWNNRGPYRGGGARNGYEYDSSQRQANYDSSEFHVGQWRGSQEEAMHKKDRYNRQSNKYQYSGQDDVFWRPGSLQKKSNQRKTLDETQDTQEGPIWHLTKNLSYFLRHGYEKEGYTLMEGGYIYIDELLKIPLFQKYSEDDVRQVTKTDPIERFDVKEDEENGKPMVKANFLQTRDMANPHIHLSKTLSYLLRHGAEKHGFVLKSGGFLYVDEVLKYKALSNYSVDDVRYVVDTNAKKRFSLEEEEGTKRLMIRANQGHSVTVEGLDLKPILSAKEAPIVIHGTYYAAWDIIKRQGISRMGRNHIHFAVGEPDENGVISGMRRSAEVLIYMNLAKCLKDGLKFFRSSNDVILSDGNEDGLIYPCYFDTVLSRKPRHMLQFDNTIAHKVDVVDGNVTHHESKKKKKKKKKRHGDKEGEPEEDKEVSEVQESKVKDDNNGVTTGAASVQTGSVAMDTDGDNNEEVIEHIKFSDIEECQNAVSFLSNYRYPVAVWCFGNQLGEPDGIIDTIVCVTQKKAYFFELTGSLDLIEEGELGSYFNARETSTKVFHSCGKASYTLFHKCKIILDGTNVYDTAVAYEFLKANGEGNLSELSEIKFTPDKWSDINKDMELQVLERCKLMLQVKEKFDSWLKKAPKKEIFEEVMSLLEKNEVKAAREKRKKEMKQKGKK